MRPKAIVEALGVVGLFAVNGISWTADPQRQADVAARGALVMPFNLGETKHVFTKTPTGGLQQVISKDPQNAQQIRMIRMHLAEIAAGFTHGDFAAPTNIHGTAMPGLAALKSARPGDITVRYSDLANGGQIEYVGRDAQLISAIHDWFDAQLRDHGADAMEGHEHSPPPGSRP